MDSETAVRAMRRGNSRNRAGRRIRTTAAAASLALIACAASPLGVGQPAGQAVGSVASAEARWTPSSEAPAGSLSHALEGQRHDLFIGLAQQGDIDLVFFGTTEAEMWWWPDRGRTVWDREFGSLRAANFGSQGTNPLSLLWRMRNGELDGYQAKLIVLQAGRPGIAADAAATVVEGYAALLDEIRLRQPQAKVLLFAPLPRGGNLETWQQRADANAAAFAGLVDNETVFYTDIGDRFFDSESRFRNATWGMDFNNRGTQLAAYEIWADAMQPWLDRFVR